MPAPVSFDKLRTNKMRLYAKAIALGTVLVFLSITAGTLNAQVVNVVTLTSTLSTQRPPVDNGTVTTTPAPQRYTLSTKQLLVFLMKAEYSEGNINYKTVPSGAKLVAVGDPYSGPTFQIWGSDNKLIVDVSDILYSNTGEYGSEVTNGAQNDVTLLASPSMTDQFILSLEYDDTGTDVGSLQFGLLGLMVNTTTDTPPNTATGLYYETQTHAATTAVGDGNYGFDVDGNAKPMVMRGSFTFSGSAKIYLTK